MALQNNFLKDEAPISRCIPKNCVLEIHREIGKTFYQLEICSKNKKAQNSGLLLNL
jgi:hypothetical protein